MNNRRKELMLASAREYCKCVVEGKTLRYNQLAEYGNFDNGVNGWYSSDATTLDANNNVLEATPHGDTFPGAYTLVTLTLNHKFLFLIDVKTSSNDISKTVGFNNSQGYDGALTNKDTNNSYTGDTNWHTFYAISTITSSDDRKKIYVRNATDTFYIRKVMFIDLTLLGLDNITTADQFFATDLGKYIAKGNYLPYETEGKFINATSPIYFEGVNIWNEQWELGTIDESTGEDIASSQIIRSKEYTKIIPNQAYYFYEGNVEWACFYFYDKNKTFISSEWKAPYQILTTPSNAIYLRFRLANAYGTTYNHDICINISDVNYNGKYYKYCGAQALEDIFAFDEQYYTGISSDFMTKKGIKYKTYDVEEITYNNLIPTNPDYLNDDTDSASANIVVHGTNGGTYWSENLTNLGFYSDIFESNTTEFVDIYMSGNNTNLYFARNVQMTSGHKYYISFNVLGNNPSNVNGLKIANLRLVDLTLLGLTDLTDKLRIFLNKNYRLPFNLTNKTIKDQATISHKEIDLSSLTWTYNTYQSCWESDISGKNLKSYSDNVVPNAIAEKYRVVSSSSTKEENDLWLYGRKPIIRIKSSDSQTTPSGKVFLELQTTELGIWLHININDYNWWVSAGTEIYKLSIDFNALGWNVLDIFSLYGKNQGSVIFLRDEYDYCFENGYIYVKTPDIQDVWNFDLLIGNAPTRMVSRRTINVESENEIDLDFTKE